jgi:hypothetical protein
MLILTLVLKELEQYPLERHSARLTIDTELASDSTKDKTHSLKSTMDLFLRFGNEILKSVGPIPRAENRKAPAMSEHMWYNLGLIRGRKEEALKHTEEPGAMLPIKRRRA